MISQPSAARARASWSLYPWVSGGTRREANVGPRHLGAAKAAAGHSECLPDPPGGGCVLRGGMAEGLAPGSPTVETTKPALGTWDAGGHAACVRHSSLCSCCRRPPEMRRPQHGPGRQLRRASAADGRRFTYHWGGEGGQKGFLLLGDPVALVQEHSVLEGEARVRSAARAGLGLPKPHQARYCLSFSFPFLVFSPK